MSSLRAALSLSSPTVIVGTLGGLALITVAAIADKGERIYLPYAILVLALTAVLRWHRDLTPRERVILFASGFMVASVMFYLWLILWANPSALRIPLLGHAWRLGFLLGVGASIGAVASVLTGARSVSR